MSAEEDTRFEMAIKNGKTFWVPVTSAVAVNGFNKWEQAFRVYSNIYCKACHSPKDCDAITHPLKGRRAYIAVKLSAMSLGFPDEVCWNTILMLCFLFTVSR